MTSSGSQTPDLFDLESNALSTRLHVPTTILSYVASSQLAPYYSHTLSTHLQSQTHICYGHNTMVISHLLPWKRYHEKGIKQEKIQCTMRVMSIVPTITHANGTAHGRVHTLVHFKNTTQHIKQLNSFKYHISVSVETCSFSSLIFPQIHIDFLNSVHFKCHNPNH